MSFTRDSKDLPKLKSIQALRGCAAVMVAIAHGSEEAKHFFAIDTLINTVPLGKGVDLFFVISGFIIYYASRNIMGSVDGVRQFAYNRSIRVIPLYYLATTLIVLTLIMFPSGLKDTKFDIYQIITSYLFIPFERYDGRIAPVLSLGWTLNYEMFFYVLFASFMWTGKRIAVVLTVSVLILLTAVGMLVSEAASAPLRFWTNNIILEFAFGIAIAVLFERYGKSVASNHALSWLLISLGFIFLYLLNLPELPFDLPRSLSAGLPAAIIVGSAVLLMPERSEAAVPGWMLLLGDSSYSLYLTHRFAQRPVQIAIRHAGLPQMVSGWLYLLIAVPTAIVVGVIVFRYVEQPMMQRFKRSRPTLPRPTVGTLGSS